MENEIWKDVEEFENLYEISNFGRLRNKPRMVNSLIGNIGFRVTTSKIKPTQDNGKGYKQYYVQINKKRYIQYAHRLVAKYFLSNHLNHPEVNHIDGVKSNNHVDNLEWVTIQENKNHAVKNGLMPSGENSKLAKLNKLQVIAIRRLYRMNPTFNREKVREKIGVSSAQISRIIHETRWKNI